MLSFFGRFLQSRTCMLWTINVRNLGDSLHSAVEIAAEFFHIFAAGPLPLGNHLYLFRIEL